MMEFKKLVYFFFFSLFMAACTSPSKTDAQKAAKSDTTMKVENKEPQQVPGMVGNDRDEHGCIGSAGYTWSVVKNECVRLFEVGIRLNAKAENLDKTLSAFVVFKSDSDDAQAEIFLPGQKGSLLLKKVKKEDAGTWKNDAYTLKQWKGMYMLDDAKGKALYEGSAAKN